MARDYEKEYLELFTANQVGLRERIATEMYRKCGFWDELTAAKMVQWIEGITKTAPPKKEIKVASWLPEKPKRKYTKRAKRWKKKRAKKAA